MLMGYTKVDWLYRDVLIECETYECAFDKLSKENLIAPVYFIIAGTQPNQGAIITRDRSGIAHIDNLTE